MRPHPRKLATALTLLSLACVDNSPFAPRQFNAGSVHPLFAAAPTEVDATSIEARLRATHLPNAGPVTDPMYGSGDPASPDYNTIVGYNHAGDGAIWTGHYLAAESYRYAVTSSAEALANARQAVATITQLVNVTSPAQPDLLARFYMPQSWTYAPSVIEIEQRHGVYSSGQYYWLGNTTRDQYAGVFFGLAIAYDLVPDDALRAQISNVVTRMLDFLIRNAWNIVMPDGSISSTFAGRYDQQLALLQIGRRVNSTRFNGTYNNYRMLYAALVGGPITTECQDPHGSYFKFNLDHITLFNLIRLEKSNSPYRSIYLQAFNTLRGCTGTHENAHFNMIERGLLGANAARDALTRDYLGQWLARPTRDYFVDLTGRYPSCGDNRACQPVPIAERPTTDFLWQRSPFLLQGGGTGTVEEPGIDYLLPYWMGRYYGVVVE